MTRQWQYYYDPVQSHLHPFHRGFVATLSKEWAIMWKVEGRLFHRLQRQMLQLPLIAQISQSKTTAKGGTPDTLLWGKVEWKEPLRIAYHPRFAAEIVDGEERVNARDATEMQANHKIPVVLTGEHAICVLPNQDKVRLERPAARWKWNWKPSINGAWLCFCYQSLRSLVKFPEA